MRTTSLFPCPVCLQPLDVRKTKRDRPYVICSPCGMQMFIRDKAGIAAFERLVESSNRDDLWTRLKELERRYQVKCPQCGKSFWIHPNLITTDWVDGSFKGFRCPDKNCRGVVKVEERRS
jgi:transcription elongation factor Elf1